MVSSSTSSGPPMRLRLTAHTLNSGILDSGSSAGSVSAFALEAPPQWNGTNSTSGRMASLSCARKTAAPRGSGARPGRWRRCPAGAPGRDGSARAGRAPWRALSRRVWVPLWYWVISRPVVSTYGYSASGVSAGARCSTRMEPGPAVRGRRSARRTSAGCPGGRPPGTARRRPSPASIRS